METENRTAGTEVSPTRILIIDDDAFQLKLLDRILTSAGYAVRAFSGPREALDFAVNDIPDMVLSDLIMPEMDGFEVVTRLKADPRTQSIPIILITAFNDRRSEEKGLALGAVDYILKPLVPPTVMARVRAHLELKQHRDSLEQSVRQRTDELVLSRRQFQDLVEKALVGVAIIQDNRVVYQNPELARIVPGFSQKMDRSDLSFVNPDDMARVEEVYRQFAGDTSIPIEVDIRVADNPHAEETWINCKAVSFRYQGKPSILVNVVDITHTKKLERLLLIRNKMASLGRIASGMAHEIRNPLTGITSYLYTLEQLCATKTLLPKDIGLMQEIIAQLKLASHKVDAVIKRVLDFAKPTALRMVSMDINQCLDNVIKLTAVTLRKAGVRVTHDFGPDLPGCFGDPGLMEQVFLNLIQNAANAVRDAQPDKHIAVRSYLEEERVVISIDDSGPGVPLGLREKIFDPFFTTSNEGSGIGLSIAHRIIGAHNGELNVDNSPLGGARFVIAIPVDNRKCLQ